MNHDDPSINRLGSLRRSLSICESFIPNCSAFASDYFVSAVTSHFQCSCIQAFMEL